MVSTIKMGVAGGLKVNHAAIGALCRCDAGRSWSDVVLTATWFGGKWIAVPLHWLPARRFARRALRRALDLAVWKR